MKRVSLVRMLVCCCVFAAPMLAACGGSGSGAGSPSPPISTIAPPSAADLVVYGASASGVIAALAAARHGKHVTLLEPTPYIGGMPASGLGSTDLYDVTQIGGIAKEFFLDVGQAYGKSSPVYAFEPHVAETVFKALLQSAHVIVVTNAQLLSVTKSSTVISSVTTSSGVFAAREFIDASYEGDLLAAAGVATTVGRESNAQYNENRNGVTPIELPSPAGTSISPYIIPSDPTSGLIPHVSNAVIASAGTADSGVQAYNYRLCLTKQASNLVPIPVPAGYDPAEFELVARLSEAMTAAGSPPYLGTFLLFAPLPNSKWDVNNYGFVSTDEVGANFAYPAGTAQSRQQTAAELKRYTLGFLTFLSSSPRLPKAVNAAMASYGLCADEFLDTDHFPHAPYVREARRMIGQYVVTEADIAKKIAVPDSIGRAGYAQDSHSVQRSHRLVNGVDVVVNEGGFFNGLGYTFPISYRSLTPRAADATNLLATICLSASHSAYLSLRVEPTYMILGQAAGTAAALAIDQNVSVQAVQYSTLGPALTADGQAL